MAKLATVKKQPNEKRRYGIDYSEALDPGDLIQSVVAVVEPAAEMTGLATTDGDTSVRLVCDGGNDLTTYKITLTVTTTNSNEIIEDEFFVKVREI
jgi:hypothetical protein